MGEAPQSRPRPSLCTFSTGAGQGLAKQLPAQPQPIPWDRWGWRGDCQATWIPPRNRRPQHSKNVSLSIITAEFYINGNFQLSCSTVSMRGLGTGGISHRRTLWQNWPSWDDTLHHAKRTHRHSACQNLPSRKPAWPREMLSLSRNPTLASHSGVSPKTKWRKCRNKLHLLYGSTETQFLKQRFKNVISI